jgi:hypothetical protein
LNRLLKSWFKILFAGGWPGRVPFHHPLSKGIRTEINSLGIGDAPELGPEHLHMKKRLKGIYKEKNN